MTELPTINGRLVHVTMQVDDANTPTQLQALVDTYDDKPHTILYRTEAIDIASREDFVHVQAILFHLASQWILDNLE